jgi:hypothetical protein
LTSPTHDSETIAAAYHEAGHAGVAVHLGLKLEQVGLTPDHPVHFGYCLEQVDDPHSLSRAVEKGDEEILLPQIRVLLAGREAQRKSGFDCVPGGDGQDLETARRVAATMVGCKVKAEELITTLRADTRRMLDAPAVWAGVEALVSQLLQDGTVEGEKAHRILQDRTRAAEPLDGTRAGMCPQMPDAFR